MSGIYRLAARAGAHTAAAAGGILVLVLGACGGGGTPTPPAPGLTVTADTTTTVASGRSITLHAALDHASGTMSWSLDGPGSLSASTGDDVAYLPPDAESFDGAGTATVTASSGSLSRSITLTLTAASVPGHHWVLARDSSPAWSDVACANGLFVAVGDGGGVRTSRDGVAWARHDTAGNEHWVSVVHGDGGWVAVGATGEIATSPDGLDWTTNAAPLFASGQVPPARMSQVAFGAGVYVAIAQNRSYVSADGKGWTPGGRGLGSIAFGNGLFVGTTTDASIAWSADGRQWTAVPSGASDLGWVAFGNGEFIAVSNLVQITSIDGKTWTPPAYPGVDPYAFVFARDDFYAITPGSVQASPDGVTWSVTGWPETTPVPTALAASADTFVGVMASGEIVSGPDLSRPQQVVEPSHGDLAAADFARGTYVALAGDNTSLTSTDGKAWKASPMITFFGGAFTGTALAHGPGGTFVAGGMESLWGFGIPENFGSYLYSADGMTWTIAQTQADHLAPAAAIIHDGSNFVSIDRAGFVSTSFTGAQWTELGSLPTFGPAKTGLAFGNGVYVVVGGAGYAATSKDAKTWTELPPIALAGRPGSDLFGLGFDGTRFVAVGAGGVVATSTDGSAWTVTASATAQTLRAVRSLEGELLAVGDHGVAETSADGIHWTLRPTALTTNLLAIGASSDTFVVSGSDATLQTSSR